MQVKTIRQPGEPGTEKLLRQYGKKLICVRYRYDYANARRYKTAEIIVTEADWDISKKSAPNPRTDYYENALCEVAVRIEYFEQDLQQKIRSIGGRWDKETKLWYALKHKVEQIKLGDRIVKWFYLYSTPHGAQGRGYIQHVIHQFYNATKSFVWW